MKIRVFTKNKSKIVQANSAEEIQLIANKYSYWEYL